jgi:uncharacterized protein DUF6438
MPDSAGSAGRAEREGMTLAAALLAAMAALAGCAGAPPPATPVQTIAFETGPCFGACPVYRLTVNSDGSGTFEGRRFTAVTGPRPFRATPAQYRAFAAQLEPLRPAAGEVRYSGEACRSMATDLPSAEVTWRSRRGEQRLYFYYGCDMERNRAIAERLTAAPGLLPIGDFIRPSR